MDDGNYISIFDLQPMNFISKLQSQYEQLWKYILRPSRTPYSEQSLGQSLFTIKGRQIMRKDFQLTNKRGYDFNCSLWLPVEPEQYSCVIYLHGNSSNRLQGTQYMKRLLVNRIALCTFDFSGCGNAQGQYVSLGYHQQQDLEEVIKHLRNYPKIKSIALWGRSMGAVTALLYLSKNKGIKVAIFDSPFKSLKELVEDMAQKTSKIPKIVLNGALKIINGTIQQKANFSIYDLNAMGAATKIQIPGFFMVGINDEVIPIEHTKDIFEGYAAEKKVIKMVKGRHNDNRPVQTIREALKFLLVQFKKSGGEAEFVKQSKEELISPKKEEGASQIISTEKVEESLKKGQFSWSNFFNVFNKNQPQKQKQPKKTQTKQELQAFRLKLAEKQKPQSVNPNTIVQKPNPTRDMAKKLEQDELQDRMKHYNYCYL